MRDVQPLITRDPAGGGELIVTRLEAPETGVAIEGRFSLGWVGKLTRDQLDFVGLLLRNRTNLQKLAGELGVAYNTVRSRLDEVVEALGGPVEPRPAPDPDRRREVLDRLAAGELSASGAAAALRGDDPD